MQIPSSCGRLEDAAWGVATVLTAILVLPFIPIVLVVSAGERWKNIAPRRERRWLTTKR